MTLDDLKASLNGLEWNDIELKEAADGCYPGSHRESRRSAKYLLTPIAPQLLADQARTKN